VSNVHWTPELVAWIRDAGPHMTRAEIASQVGCTRKALYKAAQKHQFRFSSARRCTTTGLVRVSNGSRLSDELLQEIEAARREAATAPPFRAKIGV
jgi:hypothetical protein